jgi:transcriptional regulator with AAA-type ATPase domain
LPNSNASVVSEVIFITALGGRYDFQPWPRQGDVSELAAHFRARVMPHIPNASIEQSVKTFLEERSYPGNVRDLNLLAARICARHVGPGQSPSATY